MMCRLQSSTQCRDECGDIHLWLILLLAKGGSEVFPSLVARDVAQLMSSRLTISEHGM